VRRAQGSSHLIKDRIVIVYLDECGWLEGIA
jgi:hypothetical protein